MSAPRRLDGTETGRGPSGRFAPGNPGGPGRPKRATEREYLTALAEACPPEIWREIASRAVEQALGGDPKAREWLASYLLGRAESAAGSLHALAVQEEAGCDPVARDAERERLFGS